MARRDEREENLERFFGCLGGDDVDLAGMKFRAVGEDVNDVCSSVVADHLCEILPSLADDDGDCGAFSCEHLRDAEARRGHAGRLSPAHDGDHTIHLPRAQFAELPSKPDGFDFPFGHSRDAHGARDDLAESLWSESSFHCDSPFTAEFFEGLFVPLQTDE